MLLYIWFRFEWQFAVAAIVTLMLDTTKTVGLMVLFGIEFNLTTVAAILTVIGFSANDKVVVFDRMRENLRKYKTMPLRELVDLSINETLNRSLGTSMTLLLVGAAAGAVRRRHAVGLRLGDGGRHRDLRLLLGLHRRADRALRGQGPVAPSPGACRAHAGAEAAACGDRRLGGRRVTRGRLCRLSEQQVAAWRAAFDRSKPRPVRQA